jgi:tetratricopeptide (TPR) repeat protein
MPLEYLALAKAAVGVGTALFSLTDEENRKKFLEAAFSETFGGIIADFAKDSAHSLYDKLNEKYLQKGAIDKNSLNHDLLRAVRKAQLVATFFAAQNCLKQIEFDNLPDEERNRLFKVGDVIISKIKGKKEKQIFFESVVKYLNREIQNKDIPAFKGGLSFAEFEAVFDIYRQSANKSFQTKIANELRDDILDEIKNTPKFATKIEFDAKGFEILEEAINKGWNDIPHEAFVNKKFVALNIAQPPEAIESKKDGAETFANDWFQIVCLIFNEEYKENPKVETAAQKQVLLEILGKVNKFGKLENTTVKELTAQISAFTDDLKYIRKKVDKIEERQEEHIELTKEIDKKLTQIIAPEREGVKLNLVSLPNRTDKIYGRNNEIKGILRFLREEKRHGAIVLPTCYGKTSLIKKFLYKTTDETKVKVEHRGLFEKVIYLFCYQNQNFQQIIRPFASLLGKRLEYTEGDEVNFLKQEVFDKLQDKKILFILDNFESWIDENDKYLNDEVRIFVETLFDSNHQIRTLFVSQNLPHEEKDFFKKTVELKEIEKFLLKGLDEKSALELVRDEGDEENFKYVEDARLIEFFKRVHYIPQAIQSMLAFVNEGIYTFDELMGAAWKEFEAEESDETEIEKQIPKELRPTRALLKHQLRKLDENAQHLLSLAAFFDKPVPEEILLNDFGKYKQAELRRPLSKLFKHKLILRETDAQPATDHATGAKSAIHYFELHGFVGSTVNTMFPDFITENVENLTALADQMDDKVKNAWEAKLFEKQLALIGCWEVLEQELTGNQKMSERQFNLDFVDFTKALALQETTFANNRQIDADEIKRRVEIIENLYLKWLDKYPNDAEAYNNLGTLLAKDESRRAEAEEKYLQAIKLNPNYAEAYYNLGNLLDEDESRRAEAEEKYLQAIELNPNLAQAYNNLGLLLAEDESRRAEAEEKYLQAIKLNPNYASAYYNLGNLLAEDESRRAEAEEKYLQAIKLNPNLAQAYYNLGNLLDEDESRRAEAEEKYLQAIELNPNYAKAYYNLGNLLDEDESRRAEAEEKYLQAIELNPNYAKAYGNLAFLKAIYVGENAKDEIIGNLNKFLKLNPAYKNWARNHPVFEFLRDDVRFREIVGD